MSPQFFQNLEPNILRVRDPELEEDILLDETGSFDLLENLAKFLPDLKTPARRELARWLYGRLADPSFVGGECHINVSFQLRSYE